MKKITIVILLVSVAIAGITSSSRAQMASREDAHKVANNWIRLIIDKTGDWGGSQTGEVERIQEFKRGDRVLGYFCRVNPGGHIVLSLRKELAPVKAYSTTCILDPEADADLVDVIKIGMERILNGIEIKLGPLESVRTEDLVKILEIDYRSSWRDLERGDFGKINYQQGDTLLTSHWHQNEPYNAQCPDHGCTMACGSNTNAVVGCVATAGAQVMRYWAWPPFGVGSPYDNSYDWVNMPDVFTGCTWSQVQVDAVAELCHEVGTAAGMDYGCAGSEACFASCAGPDLLDAFEDKFRYSGEADNRNRGDYDQDGWWSIIVNQLNENRPLPYRVLEHVFVCDGWQIVGSQRQYHMNYGWGWVGTCQDGCDTWYNLDELYYPSGGNLDDEKLITRLYPGPALGPFFYGDYSPGSFPYLYFDRDATSTGATFHSGYLQFLPGVKVTCTSTAGDLIEFLGTTAYNCVLYTRGDPSKGIRIYNDGHIYLYQNGSIKFH